MQPFFWETGELIANAVKAVELEKQCKLTLEPFTYNYDSGTVVVGNTDTKSIVFQQNSFFAWVGLSATLFPEAPANDLVRFRFASTDRTIGRTLQAPGFSPFDGWLSLPNVSSSPGANAGAYGVYWPEATVFAPAEQLVVSYFAGVGAGHVADRRLFLALHGVKLFPFPKGN